MSGLDAALDGVVERAFKSGARSALKAVRMLVGSGLSVDEALTRLEVLNNE